MNEPNKVPEVPFSEGLLEVNEQKGNLNEAVKRVSDGLQPQRPEQPKEGFILNG